uniref:AB hydrolase-1 domain-containing protein n=1 Tax=Oryza brachyantha TaxID=4533 RepID=J3N8B5_ORYBR
MGPIGRDWAGGGGSAAATVSLPRQEPAISPCRPDLPPRIGVDGSGGAHAAGSESGGGGGGQQDGGGRMRTFLIEAFMCHTHNAAWHTLHNILCGSAGKIDSYMDVVAGQLAWEVAVFHGRDDGLLPMECTLTVGARVPRARITVYDDKDHITIIIGQEKLFAAKLEAIWRRSAAADATDGE